jgi:hypothetical protein
MTRAYKVTYKTYFNERLKTVSFHGKVTHPLYVQVTFDRKTMFFKSYYFELFSKPRYLLLAAGKKKSPAVENVVAMENELIDFIIDKTIDDFSLDRFKKLYLYHCRDLCDISEDGFRDYLLTFFNDKGMPALATAITDGSKGKILFNIVQDLKLALKPDLYSKLIDNSFHYASPYIPLYGFIIEQKRWPLLSLTVREWTDLKTKMTFEQYIEQKYPNQDPKSLVELIEMWLKSFKG